ncbi:porin family protein [Daejeonella sp.]|uniref:porin family protein n=1 Tax=Daejeonella sp. TaxID=2805397 RepID=UPI00272F1B9C|nr:porin family protein [Daejeonella sp.]MDP2415080.1 porin family protein [Daejeonella sp.]
MKKVLILAIGVLFAGAAEAQTFGIKGGVNFSNIIKTNDRNFNTEFKPGLNAGLFVDIPVVEGLAFSPELMFSQKGYKTTGTSLLGVANEYSVTSNFIEIPILAKISAADKFSIYVGPQVSFLASTKEKFTRGDATYQNKIRNENENLKKSLVGGVIGLGVGLTDQLSLQGRYALDLQKNNENGSSETPIYKNQVIQTSLAYRFK